MDEHFNQLRAIFEASNTAVPLVNAAAVHQYFPVPPIGTLATELANELGTLIRADEDTGFTSLELRRSAATLKYEHALNGAAMDYGQVLDKIAYYVQNGIPLTAPDDKKWERIALLGRALLLLEPNMLIDNRIANVTNAIITLKARGYDLRLKDGRIDRDSPGLEHATADIHTLLGKVGLVAATQHLFDAAGRAVTHDFDQYLFGRMHAITPILREATFPLAFLFNLIVRLPDTPEEPDAPAAWNEAVMLARDLVTVLDVETYNTFAMMSPAPKMLPRLLGDIGLHDHLFGMRQWFRLLTPVLLDRMFDGADDAAMRKKHGWTVKDAAVFSSAVLTLCPATGTMLLRKNQFVSARLPAKMIDDLLPHFSHPVGSINCGYTSPVYATKADMMFKPLIALGPDDYLVPAASVAGPAFYEALRAAVQVAVGSSKTSDLVGSGTERVTAELFQRKGYKPTRRGETYRSATGTEAGECDLVLEDTANVVFIECKAKALTRATMSGEIVDALVDYAGSFVASQAQALRHERILMDEGEIRFDDGHVLKLNGRTVTRLTITLLDHGTFQDSFVVSNFAYPVLAAKIKFDPAHPKADSYQKVNEDIEELNQEYIKAGTQGRDVWASTLGAASLSVGQLAVLINDCTTVADLVRRIRRHFSFGTMNVLLEYHHAKARGLC